MYVILLALLVFVSATLSGIFAPPFKPGKEDITNVPEYKCCDTGDKEDCHAQMDKTLPYKGQIYALLKSDLYLYDYGNTEEEHFFQSQNPSHAPDGRRIFLNNSQVRKQPKWHYPECRPGPWAPNDALYGQPDPRNSPPSKPGCYFIPDDILIYLCTPVTGSCDDRIVRTGGVKWDVYIRTSKGEPIPDVVKNCYKPPIPPTTQKKIKFRPSPDGQPNLQLRTFSFVYDKLPVTWLSPYCKPAIYLYPEKKSEINVSVFPQGEMLLTIPPYPKTGWDVIAEPNGNIYHQNSHFDYLYYEASLPDQLIPQPKEGYVMNYDERALFLTNLVTKLGLNEKETKQFVEYWVPILPKAKYYFVGVIPQKTLHELSPVIITPKPKNLIRVTLYFKPLDEKISVTPPLIVPISRDGYTAVEWGGIYKRDKDHPFSCFM